MAQQKTAQQRTNKEIKGTMTAYHTELQARKEENEELKETKWIDAWIRWDKNDDYTDGDEDDDEEEDDVPHPTETFSFSFLNPSYNSATIPTAADTKFIDIELHGYKSESEQIWNSTGLTLWRSAEHLCEYVANHSSILQPNKRVLELGSGLGLCGIFAHQLMLRNHGETSSNIDQDVKNDEALSSCIFLTDGDTDVLSQLRANVNHNHQSASNSRTLPRSHDSDNKGDNYATASLSCHQLLWGRDNANEFVKRHCLIGGEDCDNVETSATNKSLPPSCLFDVILGADLVYAPRVIQPLFETVKVLLKPSNGIFLFAYCSRRQGSTSLDLVLETATKFEFTYECVNKDDDDDGISIYIFRPL